MFILSEHQKRPCRMCADDAVRHNHCSWCGGTFASQDGLVRHLDDNSECWRNLQMANRLIW